MMATGEERTGGTRHDPAGRLRDVLSRHSEQERREAMRALLMQPLMTMAHPQFGSVRRHAAELRNWFSQVAGWRLHVGPDCARLYKWASDLNDGSRGAPGFERRRYVLFCLACLVLERADMQITLKVLGERLLQVAAVNFRH